MMLDVYERLRPRFPTLVLVLAPRHPERTEEVERLIVERGLRSLRRTALSADTGARGAVVILDTVGELADLYRLAAMVFVGGSLVAAGGHNMLEPALRRKPVLYGPHTENFRDSASVLEVAGGAIVVKDASALLAHMNRLLSDRHAREAMGEAGFAAVAARQGAVAQTLKLVEWVLVGGNPPRDAR
jgi:3-deoxy-D-manno-octulosonic-acid transferase